MRCATRGFLWAGVLMVSLVAQGAGAQEQAMEGVLHRAPNPPVVDIERLRSIDAVIPFRVLDVVVRKRLQHELRRRGYYGAPVDGVPGRKTQRALRAFQEDRGLQPTAQLDLATARALDLGLVVDLQKGGKAASGESSHQGVRAERASEAAADPRVRAAQRALKGRGFHASEVDGILGPDTRSSLQRFQEANGLETTGKLDEPTLRALGLAEERAGEPEGGQEPDGKGVRPDDGEEESPADDEVDDGPGYDRWDPDDVKRRLPA